MAGYDGVTTLLLKHIIELIIIIDPLVCIYNLCIKQSVFLDNPNVAGY